MDNLYNLLHEVKENPVPYLSKPSLNCLHLFLIGYLSTRFELELDREGTILDGFQEWIQERAKTYGSQSWAGIILFICGSERSAFYSFFELLDEFLSRKEILTSKNISEKIVKVNRDNLRTLFELLAGIKKRPGMYLGTNSITNLDMVLRGRNLALRELGVAPTEEEREIEDFQAWIQERYGINSGQSWAKIILFFSIDEREALERFFELFEEFLNRDKSSELIAKTSH